MNDQHRNVLQKNFAYLIKHLSNIDSICDELYQNGILTSSMQDSIKNKKPAPSAQIRELLSILPRRGGEAYDYFIKALYEAENTGVANYLRERDGSKIKETSPSKPSDMSDNKNIGTPKDCNGDTKVTTKQHSGKIEENKKLASTNIQDWPDLSKKLEFVKEDDIIKCTEESLTKICENKNGKVYDMTGKTKGKLIIISNVQCTDHDTAANSTDDALSKKTEKVQKCGRLVDFDQTAISKLFTEIKYESKAADIKKGVSEEEMTTFLAGKLDKRENSTSDSLVVVIFSGGLNYKPGQIYDKDGKELDRDRILEMIGKSEAFKNKPKIVIIRTYNFEEETEAIDSLDAEKHDIPFHTKEPNQDDLFVVSSKPRPKKGPWIVGDEIQGSYFIQALIHVFKNMAYDKTFMEMMKEIDNCLTSAVVPGKGKQDVANVMILEHSKQKELFFFPGLTGIVTGWPDLKRGVKLVQKKDIEPCSGDFYDKISNEKMAYPMKSVKRGKFILISNTQCKPQSSKTKTKEEEEMENRFKGCLGKSDLDKSNMSMLFKFMGFDMDAIQIDKTKKEIKDILKRRFSEIDTDVSSNYDSLVIMFLSAKYESSATKIYDIDGEDVPQNEILEIIKDCKHFEGKPKVVFIQTYNCKEAEGVIDSTDITATDIIKNIDPNMDDIFVVSSYKKTEKGPWIIGENMSGSYFIQALVHVFKKFACEKSFMELLQETNMCLNHAVVPEMKEDSKNSGKVEKKHVAQIVLLQFCEKKKLYFFPGHKNASSSGNPVCTPSDDNNAKT
ncbi:caspase-2-like isoform X2 [Mytilus galloprovincialis]|uniref:caspase-2-like isoform X2 n=1 Tax=Mytilus galloprovincialis TaxID=29158 RepID=UPI003F7B88B7